VYLHILLRWLLSLLLVLLWWLSLRWCHHLLWWSLSLHLLLLWVSLRWSLALHLLLLLWWSLALHLLLLLWWSLALDLLLGWSLILTIDLLLLHHLVSLLHLSHHFWVKLVLVNSASQMMGGEQNVNVVGVEDLVHLLLALLNVHCWGDWQSLDEEHGVLKLDLVWSVFLLPDNLDGLCESCWDETALGNDLHVKRGGGEDMEGNETLLTWVGDLELRNQVTFNVLEVNLLSWAHVDEVGADVNSRLETDALSVNFIVIRAAAFGFSVVISVVWISHSFLVFHELFNFSSEFVHYIALVVGIAGVGHLYFKYTKNLL
jgi:hypothetical protein